MSPRDFLSLADRLSKVDGEAERRSAISRAYYGLFHEARLLVEGCGVRCPESGEAHDRVTKCLMNAGDSTLAAAGREINSLRTIRNLADYRLSDGRFRNAKFIQTQLLVANRLVSSLEINDKDRAAIQTAVRAYASDVLKMSLKSDS